MGTLFAYHLAESNDVTLVDVRADTVRAIEKAGGVRVDDGELRDVSATCDPTKVYATNCLFVFVKAPHTLAAVRPFAGKLNPATPIVSLQNGLGNEEAIKAALGGTVPLIIGITDVTAVTESDGHSLRQGAGTTVIGSGGASTQTVRAAQTLLSDAGLECVIAYDIRPHQWGKLLANAAINAIAALTDSDNAIVTSDRDAAELSRAVALEGATIARAMRVSLPFADVWEYVRGIVASTADSRNSMTIDLGAGRKTEIDQVNGAIVAGGRRHGIATPYNDALLRLVRAKERAPLERGV